MFKKLIKRYKEYKMSLRTKLIIAMSSVATILLLSSVISVLEYRRMSNYVSDLIQANISSIDMAQKLIYVTEQYNLDILTVIGEEELTRVPQIDQKEFMTQFDNLKAGFSTERDRAKADSVTYAYSAYLLTAMELEDVYNSRFVDTRDWYFQRLQPRFEKLRGHIESLVNMTYSELKTNSSTFQQGFYRSIIPGVVSVAAGIMLVLLLMFFLIVYYVNPLYKMLDKLKNYREHGIKYNYTFEGDDQLAELNENLSDITSENFELRKKRQY